MLHFDALDGFAEPTPQKLERDVARANERAHATREENLHAPRRPKRDRSERERLSELPGRNDEREHARAPDGGEPWIVGDRQTGWRTETLEMNGRRKADA